MNKGNGQLQANLDALIDASPTPFVEWTPELRLSRWSSAARALFGWDETDLLGRAPAASPFLSGEDLALCTGALRALTRGEPAAPAFRATVICRNGSPLVCRWHIRAQYEESGALKALFAFIAPLPSPVGSVGASAKHWQRFFRGSHLGLAVHDALNNRIIEANPAYARLHGYTIDELRGMRVEGLYPEDEQESLRHYLGRADTEGEVSFESWHVRRDGSTFPVLMGMTSITDAAGRPIERYVSLIDITDRKTAEERLRVLSRAIEESPESIVITNIRAEIEYVNPAFTRKSGYAMDEVLGRNPRVLHSGKTPPETYLSLWQTLARDEPWTGEFHNRNKNGDEYLERAKIAPIHDGAGRVSHYIAIKEDITEQRRMMEELAKYREQLEQLVEQRTHELRDALHAANEASRSKSDFLATMSHEIRTPMNGVLGIVEVLAHTPLTEDQRTLVATMRQSAESLLALIDDILDFSKMEAGKLTLEFRPEQMEAMLDEIADTLQPLAAKQGVDLRIFAHPGLPDRVLCDRLRFRQIIFNLVSNALKFSSGQACRGQVLVRFEVVDDHRLGVSVTDNGIGMTPAQLETVFEPFRQAEQDTTRRFGGTGLGLTITRRLVDAFEGHMQIESLPGHGTSVRVALPLRIVEGGDEANEQTLNDTCCVIALTDASAASDWSTYLRFAGARVSIATSLEGAIHELADAQGDKRVLITDRSLSAGLAGSWLAVSNAARPGLIVVDHGRRQTPREESHRSYAIDLEAARRRNLVEAARLAAGGEPGPRTVGPNTRKNPDQALLSPSLAARLAPVLVVEDHDINRKVIGRQLELLGLRYSMAANGVEALRALDKEDFSMMLTDLHMPLMDGYALVTAVRQAERTGTRLPIIAITANALRGEEERCRSVGMDAYLVKPVQLEALARAIRSVVSTPEDPPDDQDGTSAPAEYAIQHASPKPEPLSPAVFDPAILKQLVGGDPGMVLEFLEAYSTSARRTADELLGAVARQDWSGAGAAAHKLKSASRYVGANALGELCATLEALGRAGDGSAMQALLPYFEPLVGETLRMAGKAARPTES